jgi:hemerythrin
MSVQWTSDLAVGVTQIDDQHKELFKRLNDLLEAMSKGKGREEIDKVVSFLANYVISHFETEEKLMARHSYPQFVAHKTQHSIFVSDFTNMKRNFESGVSVSSVIAVQKRISDWLVNHIGKTDKALGAFLNSLQMKKAA